MKDEQHQERQTHTSMNRERAGMEQETNSSIRDYSFADSPAICFFRLGGLFWSEGAADQLIIWVAMKPGSDGDFELTRHCQLNFIAAQL